MERVNKILKNQKYVDYLNRNVKAEKNRIFCHHDLRHYLDVARVAYILALEKNISIKKDVIYAAALLHDIGRWKEYLEGVDHAAASATLAKDILESSGFDNDEQAIIKEAIKNHRKYDAKNPPLDKILYRSDKLSRPCMECTVVAKCKRFGVGESPKLFY
ncbi:HD domain-containing protein [Crassaminicella profunda]|uniref:HD domain-containing protein n=1 Tax=Crassaminicella profunda TaxID=1286698 RepID=UPI001CA70A3E|nr:HD domain-containing protein [Crassaminicella profunda]QZY54809.1 HD domain-containing protein [Crassaminicella profunda]